MLAPEAAEVDVLVTYADGFAPTETDFTHLHERYHSDTRGHYLTGTIRLDRLARARWLRAPGVCVVRLATPLRAATTPRPASAGSNAPRAGSAGVLTRDARRPVGARPRPRK